MDPRFSFAFFPVGTTSTATKCNCIKNYIWIPNVEEQVNLKTLSGSWVRLVLGISVTLNQFGANFDSIHTQIFSFFED